MSTKLDMEYASKILSDVTSLAVRNSRLDEDYANNVVEGVNSFILEIRRLETLVGRYERDLKYLISISDTTRLIKFAAQFDYEITRLQSGLCIG